MQGAPEMFGDAYQMTLENENGNPRSIVKLASVPWLYIKLSSVRTKAYLTC